MPSRQRFFQNMVKGACPRCGRCCYRWVRWRPVAFYLKIGACACRATLRRRVHDRIGDPDAVGRGLFLRHARAILGGNLYSTVLISDGLQPPATGDFSAYISADTWLDPDNDCPVMYDRLAKALHEADRAVVNCSPERRQTWVNALKGANIRS